MRVLVTGGTGGLGSLVLAEVGRRGHDAVAGSRRTGLDLATGAGLAGALEGVEAVVHCATNALKTRAVDVEGTRRLARALVARHQPGHLVYISIVGCDQNPYFYYRAKTAAEQAIEEAGGPATIVRATQFHSLAAFFGRLLSVGPVSFTIGDMAVQPVDAMWVAARLAEIAVGPTPAGCFRATDLAGPEVVSAADLAGRLRAHAGKGPARVVRIPPVGRTMRAFSARTTVPSGPVETGGVDFDTWLAAQPRRLRGR